MQNQNRRDSTSRQSGQGNVMQLVAFMANQNNVNSYIASPETVIDPNWYADTGVSNHVKADYNNLANPTDYEGNECVTVGGGSKLQITYIGNSCLRVGNKKFSLENVLCVVIIIFMLNFMKIFAL